MRNTFGKICTETIHTHEESLASVVQGLGGGGGLLLHALQEEAMDKQQMGWQGCHA